MLMLRLRTSSTDVVVSALLGPVSLRTQLCKEDLTWLRGVVGMEGVPIVPRPAHSKKKAQRQQETAGAAATSDATDATEAAATAEPPASAAGDVPATK